MGVSLAMDDFGTGYFTLDVLSQWPFTVVKLHQGLISRLFSCEKSSIIVRTSIYMAHQLGIKVVAEGIENPAVYEFLLRGGCTEAQGYWMGRPMPLEALLVYLKSGRRWPASPVGLIHIAQLDHLQRRRNFMEQVIAR
jgi:EAL domain-containing protein (putative c-di-GMP-specific phosphodiesterase class I)